MLRSQSHYEIYFMKKMMVYELAVIVWLYQENQIKKPIISKLIEIVWMWRKKDEMEMHYLSTIKIVDEINEMLLGQIEVVDEM